MNATKPLKISGTNMESRLARLVDCPRCGAGYTEACSMYRGYGAQVQAHSERRGFWIKVRRRADVTIPAGIARALKSLRLLRACRCADCAVLA